MQNTTKQSQKCKHENNNKIKNKQIKSYQANNGKNKHKQCNKLQNKITNKIN